MEKDFLLRMWEIQKQQQADLGLDPRYMNGVNKRVAAGELIQGLYEELSELQRYASTYKRHILSVEGVNKGNVTEEIVDVLKLLISVAQLHGISPVDLVSAFERKTRVIAAKAEGQRVELCVNTKVLCVDMDDVIADLSPWVKEQQELRGDAPMNAKTMQLVEAWKGDWYRLGRFLELRPIEGASTALGVVKSWGWKVIIITARPQWQYKRIYADTLEWLRAHEVPHDLILFNKDKVEAIYDHISPAWPVAFVEDQERNAVQLSAAGVKVLLFDTERNQDFVLPNGVQRVANWTEVLLALEKRKKGGRR